MFSDPCENIKQTRKKNNNRDKTLGILDMEINLKFNIRVTNSIILRCWPDKHVEL